MANDPNPLDVPDGALWPAAPLPALVLELEVALAIAGGFARKLGRV
jgi:hypothetical protein